MKKTILAFFTPVVVVAIFAFYNHTAYYSPHKGFSVADRIDGAIDYFNKIRANRITGRVDLADVENARNQIKALESSRIKSSVNLSWQEMGPDDVGGRTRALMLDKDSVNVIYAGGVAGGLWKSRDGGASWSVLFDNNEVNTISCITQASNGDIYVGTGEGHYDIGSGNGTGAGGMIGSGIYKSIDRGDHWTRLNSTIPTILNSYTVAFAYVNEVATKPGNPQRVYASTNKGLRMSNDGGQTWINPIHSPENNFSSGDVKVGSDGTVIASLVGNAYISPNGNDSTFIKISTGNSGALPASGVTRIEFAFAPQTPNYIYASLASSQGSLLGLYQSKDKGQNWYNIANGGVNPLGGQGTYDNCIVVSAQNKDKIFVGGTQLYSCFANASPLPIWTRISAQYPGSADFYRYVHPDMHVLLSDPTSSQTLYISCDGGIFKTSNLQTSSSGGPSFIDLNNGYNVTQFYAISPTAKGGVVGGCQDNGSKYINTMGGFSRHSVTIGGGDGGYTEASFLIDTVFFSTVYYGALARSFDAGGSGSSFYNDRIQLLPNFNNPGFASFITPIALYENFNDTMSPDSVNYIVKATDNTAIGGILTIKSKVAGVNSQYKKYFNDTNKVIRTVGQTIRVKDILQSRLAVGFTNSVWLTKHAIDESGPVNWLRIGFDGSVPGSSPFQGEAKILRFSKDGNYLYVGTFDGSLYRFSNLNTVTYDDTLTGEIGEPECKIVCKKIKSFNSRAVCGISIDPNNNDKVVVTLGNYGSNDYVYVTNNATDVIPLFTNIQNNLPKMPIYDALIDMNHPNIILLGTEYGVWTTDDNGTTWSQSTGFPGVPVLCLRQQIFAPSATVSNTGVIFAATHGRGVWKSNSLVGIKDIFSSNHSSDISVRVSPNPTKDIATVNFYTENPSSVRIKIYSLQGKLVRNINAGIMAKGKNNFKFPVEDFDAGTYIISIDTDGKQVNAKFIVMK